MKDNLLVYGSEASEPDPREQRIAWITLVLILVSVIVSTVLHHGFPSVFNVPSNDGVPMSDYPTMFVLDMLTYGMAWLCFRHGWKRLGLFGAVTFLGGSFIYTGIEESMWILIGRFAMDVQTAIPGAESVAAVKNGTYYFTRGFFWFIETPMSACVGWYMLAYSCMYIAELVFSRSGVVWRAFIAGFIAMNIDLWLDPIQTHPIFLSWIWADQPGGIWIFSIPITNFVGWFFLIFLYALVFDKLPAMVERWGPGKAVLRFYFILFCLEIAILIFFIVYGWVEQAAISPKLNLTFGGI